jgi:hypothetical protein
MLWTGLGFTLLITALSMEMYFMMNAFWSKSGIIDGSQNHFKDTSYFNFYLTNLNLGSPKSMTSITGGFRCALANMVAFSAIIGRAGPLEALFVAVFGTIGYELNRQILERFSIDSGGTSAIFIFGGFMGLVIGLFRYLAERGDNNNTIQH